MIKVTTDISGGGSLKKHLEAVRKRAREVKRTDVTVGFHGEKKGLANVARQHEFGVASRERGGTLPPRPFMREAIRTVAPKIAHILKAEKLLPDDATLEDVGKLVVEAMQRELEHGSFTPLAPDTAKRKAAAGEPAQPLLTRVAELVKGISFRMDG